MHRNIVQHSKKVKAAPPPWCGALATKTSALFVDDVPFKFIWLIWTWADLNAKENIYIAAKFVTICLFYGTFIVNLQSNLINNLIFLYMIGTKHLTECPILTSNRAKFN